MTKNFRNFVLAAFAAAVAGVGAQALSPVGLRAAGEAGSWGEKWTRGEKVICICSGDECWPCGNLEGPGEPEEVES